MRIVLRVLAVLLVVVLLAGAWIYAALTPPAPLEPGSAEFVLDGVTVVVPGEEGRREANRRVVVKDGRIARIEAATGSGEYAGAFVLPGLTDAHVHFPPPTLPGQTELFAFLMLKHGITAVRDPADVDGKSSEPARDGVREGRFPGPRIFLCGPFLDGDPPLWGNSIVISSPDEARAAVNEVADRGFDCLKAYNGLEADELAALHEAADERGLPVIGHVPAKVPYEVALLDDAQHMIGVHPKPEEDLPFPFVLVGWHDMDDARRQMIVDTMRAHGLTQTPTLITADRLLASRDYESLLKLPEAQLLPSLYRDVLWHPQEGLSPVRFMEEKDFDMVAKAQVEMFATVKFLHDAGVELHSGTDTLVYWIVPGAGLHRELRLLNRAGIPAEDVMAITSVASARYIDREGVGLGDLRAGGPAEFVVFRDDPTRDLAALDTIEAVVRDGRFYTREALDAQLARYREWFEGVVFESVLTPLTRRALAAVVPDRDGD